MVTPTSFVFHIAAHYVWSSQPFCRDYLISFSFLH